MGVASLVIRRLDDEVKARLRVRAAEHNRSMEEEAREILREVLTPDTGTPSWAGDLVSAIRSRFAPFGFVDDLVLPAREQLREPPDFGDDRS